VGGDYTGKACLILKYDRTVFAAYDGVVSSSLRFSSNLTYVMLSPRAINELCQRSEKVAVSSLVLLDCWGKGGARLLVVVGDILLSLRSILRSPS